MYIRYFHSTFLPQGKEIGFKRSQYIGYVYMNLCAAISISELTTIHEIY
jgi:hypothetical protein